MEQTAGDMSIGPASIDTSKMVTMTEERGSGAKR